RLGIGVVSMGGLVPESRAVDFDSVAEGETHTWRATQEFNVLGQLLAGVEWGELDVLLLDLPPGAERTLQYAEFLGGRTAFVVVTIPADLARGVVARSIEALGRTPCAILGYVENMCGYSCPSCGEVGPLFPGSGDVELGVPCLGRVPFDPRLAELSDSGEAVGAGEAPPSVHAIQAVADTLEHVWEAGR
ncbi:MAG: P-loop NTPase, partial [Acidobacteriota bacterium]|nr:P-loop NTPase [Acidobacteriota bacterium]